MVGKYIPYVTAVGLVIFTMLCSLLGLLVWQKHPGSAELAMKVIGGAVFCMGLVLAHLKGVEAESLGDIVKKIISESEPPPPIVTNIVNVPPNPVPKLPDESEEVSK